MFDLPAQLKTGLAQNIPWLIGKPLQFIPFSFQQYLIANIMNRVFQEPLLAGDMAFLKNCLIKFKIEDCNLDFTLTYNGQSLEIVDTNRADASIQCKLQDFILLANQEVDPDTLFFQRRLIIEGDTELGLTMKNLMDTLDPENLPYPLLKGLLVLKNLLIENNYK